MVTVSQDYISSLPTIYRDILKAFPQLEPARRRGYGLMYPTLFAALKDHYSPGEIIQACQQLAAGGAVMIERDVFVRPTPIGEDIIEALTGKKAGEVHVPPFSPPPTT